MNQAVILCFFSQPLGPAYPSKHGIYYLNIIFTSRPVQLSVSDQVTKGFPAFANCFRAGNSWSNYSIPFSSTILVKSLMMYFIVFSTTKTVFISYINFRNSRFNFTTNYYILNMITYLKSLFVNDMLSKFSFIIYIIVKL